VTVAMAGLSDGPLDLAAVVAAVAGPAAGATAAFCGTVRDHAPGVEGVVTGLDYSAHPGAADVLARVAAEVVGARAAGGGGHGPEVVTVAVVHRTGRLGVGELAVAAAASAAHRDTAFDVCRELVDRVKSEVPIWKREHVAGRGAHWVGLGPDQQP